MTKIRRKLLTIPDVIEANNIPKGSEEPQGIIYKIRSQVADITSYVQPSYTSFYTGDINALVKWENLIITTGQSSYLQVKFEYGFVYPTSYSLKGDYLGNCFAKEWILYGFNEPEGQMTTLSTNKSQGSTFCGTNTGCNSGNWGTFSVNPMQKAFKYFRIVSTAPSCSIWYLTLCGFELTGIYSLDGRTAAKKKRNHFVTCAPSSSFSLYSVLIFVVYAC